MSIFSGRGQQEYKFSGGGLPEKGGVRGFWFFWSGGADMKEGAPFFWAGGGAETPLETMQMEDTPYEKAVPKSF